ncbi:CPBP family intramembrane glutamic endopeptidase [Sediminibacillus massiliensis]|uniref:CPBP family intramembrane glutamic endopeptidase n=1 Tax=Sediminibacillus massiliensis TaxID=1926277 RepID=UPI0009885BFF|nr:type II CAAX endopeptidase family protein [Sediminibacillus massiliensis]
MKFTNQAKIARKMPYKQLIKQLYLSQFIFFLFTLGISLFLFDSPSRWLGLFSWKPQQLFFYGVIPGLVVVLIDLVLVRVFPEESFDDGGINEKVFRNASIPHIFLLAAVISISEELLFRGVLQTELGYITASLLFALVHFRYLTKPVLLFSVLVLSFFIGWLYETTANLLTTITAHFLIDLLLGLIIKSKKGKGES